MSSHMESLPHLEMKLTLLKKTLPPPPLKNEVPFQEILTRKRIQILHFINICVSLVKQHGKSWQLFFKNNSSHLQFSLYEKFLRTLELLQNIASLD